MNVKWLLEPELFEGEEEPILDALTKFGVEHETVKFGNSYEDYLKSFKDTDCVVFHGSLQLGRLLQKEVKWIPGVYCNLPKFECVYYYPRLGRHLLNSDYVMLPFGELDRRKEWLFEIFRYEEPEEYDIPECLEPECLEPEESFFIRPSSGFKTFTGKVVTRKTWDEDVKLFGFYGIDPQAIVIAAPSIGIESEWRLLVVDNKVITASQYKHKERPKPPAEVLAYGQKVLDESNYRPDSAWVLDICRTKGGSLRVVEAGSFSCCGLYNCDPEAIVREVSKVALRDWQAKQA